MSTFAGSGFHRMWAVSDQIPNRGSIGVSHTVDNQDGIALASGQLLDLGVQLLGSRPLDRRHEALLHQLEPASLSRAAHAAVEALPTWEHEDRTLSALTQRLGLLKELGACTLSQRARDVRRVVAATVSEAAEQLLTSLRQCFDVNPQATGGEIQAIRAALAEYTWPSSNGAAHKRLTRIVALLAELPAYEDQVTRELYQRILSDQLRAGWESATAALHEVVQSLTADAWRRQWPQLQASLQDLGRRCLLFDQQLKRLHDLLDDHARAVREEQQHRASSIALPLPGPTAEEVISGMKCANHCSDTPSLASKLFGEFDLRLRQLARESFPHLDADGSSFVTLLLDLPAEEGKGAWLRLVAERLGDGHSLYARVDQVGVEEVARFLWTRSAPTTHFHGRDQERFGTSLTEIAIWRLPASVAPNDPPIRERLIRHCRSVSPNCHVVPGAADDTEISVCRINCGFAIGIESANHSLIQSYGEAAEHGHLPHLAGIVADSELGRPSPAYLRLLDHTPSR
ncbi:MAG: hypothetical protein AB7F89_20275 [Pirellulaceae bacterium]